MTKPYVKPAMASLVRACPTPHVRHSCHGSRHIGWSPRGVWCHPCVIQWPAARRVQANMTPCAVAMAPQSSDLLLRPPWRLDVYAVDLDRRVMEHRRAFGRRVGPGEPFECVVQHVIGKGDFVRRKVAFEHATLRTELLNTVLHPRRH